MENKKTIVEYVVERMTSDTCILVGIKTSKDASNMELFVPHFVNGMKVVIIGSRAFAVESPFLKNNPSFKKIVVPNTVKQVFQGAFCSTYAEEIHIPASITKIPTNCFSGSRIGSIVFENPNTITRVGDAAFSGTDISEFAWPSNAKKIPDSCFDSSFIKELKGIENVEVIGKGAFRGTRFEEFIWPNKCDHIPEACFAESDIRKVTNINHIQKIDESAFARSELEEFEWPKECKTIPNNCFSYASLKAIKIPDEVEHIFGDAFLYTTNLRSIEWPSNCKEVPYQCFAGSGIKELVLKNVERVFDRAFVYSQLERIKFTSGIVTISEDAFPERTVIDAQQCEEVKVIKSHKHTSLIEHMQKGFDTYVVYM